MDDFRVQRAAASFAEASDRAARSERPDMLAGPAADYTTEVAVPTGVNSTVAASLSARGDTGPAVGPAGNFHRSLTTGTTHGALERYEYRTRLRHDQPRGQPRRRPHPREPEKTNVASLSPETGPPAGAGTAPQRLRHERVRHRLRSDDRGQDHRLRPHPHRRTLQGRRAGRRQRHPRYRRAPGGPGQGQRRRRRRRAASATSRTPSASSCSKAA